MVTKERPAVKVNDMHRKIMRRIPLRLLEKAYHELHDGCSECSVCIELGVSPEVFDGILKPVIIDALWERGRSHFIHAAESVNLIAR